MSRKTTPIRPKAPDAKYNSVLVGSLINKIMYDGKKSIAEAVVYEAFDKIKEQGMDPLETYSAALQNLKPSWEVRYRRVGGTTVAVPRAPSNKRADFQSLSWLVNSARERSEYRISDKLSNEIVAASKKEGSAMQAKVQLEKLAEANKAFAGFNW